ncbi:MAG: hypothetical protein AAFR38_07075 [Planctomycetota bacterium]
MPEPAAPVRRTVCPYCGAFARADQPCGSCGGRFDALSRRASQDEMGPWFVRDQARPHMPGCRFETIERMIERGVITPDTVVRGPSTNQFWTLARWAPGIAELFGMCHACGSAVRPGQFLCSNCSSPLTIDRDRQHLGLLPPSGLREPTTAALDRPVVHTESPVGLQPPAPDAFQSVDLEPESEPRGAARARRSGMPVLAIAAIVTVLLLAAAAGWTKDLWLSTSEPRAEAAPTAESAVPAPATGPETESAVADLAPEPEASEPAGPTWASERPRIEALIAIGDRASLEAARDALLALESTGELGEEASLALETVQRELVRLRLRDPGI